MTLESAGGRRDSQAARIARDLVERITKGTYGAGDRLPSERLLASEFGVSRPVIREALSTIQALQIIDIQMGRGAFVTNVPSEPLRTTGAPKLQDVVNTREVLEVGALTLAARRSDAAAMQVVQRALDRLRADVAARSDTVEADRSLHSAIVQAAGSPLLSSIWESIDQQIVETIRISPHGKTMSADILALHEALAIGLIEGDLDRSISASRSLHEDNRRFLHELLS